MKNQKPVSAIVVTRDRKEDLLECVGSLQNSSYKLSEIIVVDNASKIPVATYLRKRYPKVKVIRNSTNMGVAAGRNIGIINSKDDYFLFIDDDARADKDMVRYLMEVFEEKKRAGIVQPKVYDKQRPNILQGAGHGINFLTGRVYAWGVMEEDEGQYDKLRKIPMTGGICIVKKAVVKKIGMFDEDYFIPYEDSDFSYRASQAGFGIYCSGQAKSWHQGKKTTYVNPTLEWLGITTPERAFRVARNKIIFMRKHAPIANFLFFCLVLLPAYGLMHSVLIVSSGRLDILSKYWQGLLAGIFYIFKSGYTKLDSALFDFKLQLDAWVDPVCRLIDKSAETILDVGCGPGYPMRLIRLVVTPKYVVGVDLFEKYINEAKKDNLHNKYIISDIRKMKFPKKSFDVVLASHVIEHLPQKDGPKFIKDLETIAKKQVIIVTPIGKSYHPAVDENILQLHISHYYPQDFNKLGYKVLKFGRKGIIGETGAVHTIKIDPIKKLLFLIHLVTSPLYYVFPDLANCNFVAYKDMQ